MPDLIPGAPAAVAAALDRLKDELTAAAGSNLAGLILYGGLARTRRSAVAPIYSAPEFVTLRSLLADYQPVQGIHLDHRYFQRAAPCTMLIEEVTSLLGAIRQSDDWSPFEAKLADIADMADAYSAPTSQENAPEA